MCNVNINQVCKRWRDVTRQAWSTRRSICINQEEMAFTNSEGKYVQFDSRTPKENVIDKFLVAKNIGHALTRLELDFDMGDERISLTALAQNCFNLQHLDLR